MGRTTSKIRDEQVYEYVKGYLARQGYAPSYREIKRGCGLSSTALVKQSLERLSEAGRVEWQPGLARSVRLAVDGGGDTVVARRPEEGKVWA